MTRTNDLSKFGLYSLRVTNSAANEEDFIVASFTPSINTVYNVSAWANVINFEAAAANKRGLYVYDATAASGKGTSIVGTSNGWERHIVRIATGGTVSTVQVRLYAPKGTVYWDGIQVETGEVATPFVYTDGATATRSAGNISIINDINYGQILNEVNSWFAAKIRIGWDFDKCAISSSAAAHILEAGVTVSGKISLAYNSVNKYWTLIRRDSSVSSAVQKFQRGDLVTIIGYWTSTSINISINGSAFVSSANTNNVEFEASNLVFIGNVLASSSPINSDVLWVATGDGSLTDADALFMSTLDDPAFTDLPGNPTFVWWADSDKARIISGRTYESDYKVKIDTKITDPRTSY